MNVHRSAIGGSFGRLNAALMPDYNRGAAAYWWGGVVAGAVVLLWAGAWLVGQPWPVWAQLAAAMALAVGSGLFPVRVPGTQTSIAAGEIFIVLVLLAVGPQAATLVVASEVALAAFRTSRRWTSRLLSPAMAALSMASTGSLLHAVLGRLDARGLDGAAPALAATLLFAGLYFFVNAVLLSGSQHLKRGEPYFQLLRVVSLYRWVAMAYAGSASIALLLYITWRQQGAGVLMVMVPLLAMLLVTLHFYFRQQEVGEALRVASADADLRLAAMAERERLAVERHLQELQASESRFHSAFTHASIGMALLGFDGRILQANPALAALLGSTEAELAEQNFASRVLAEDRDRLEQRLGLGPARDFEAFSDELRLAHRDGSVVWLAVHCNFFTEPPPPGSAGAGQPCLILQAQDVTARRRAEDGLQQLAFHDPLTGLPNRRRFLECLVGAVARFKANPQHAWAVMFIDFDRFKLVNDSLGHGAGDELLQHMGRRVQEKVRPNDIVARLGGDEFAILVTDIESEGAAMALADRLMEALQAPFFLQTTQGTVEVIASASIGITFSAIGYDTADEVLRDADTAMYKAKAGGKARYAIFDSSLHTAVAERLRLEGELRVAIAQGQLSVVYQPVFDLTGGPGPGHGRLHGFEALVRWQHPQDGTLVPSAFLPIAAESGQMVQLSDFVLHCACHQLRRWQLSDPALANLTMSINLSAHDLAHPGLVARVSRAVIEAGLRPEHLTLELTEDILMAHIEGVQATLMALRQLGARLAVDDFGTGYSSLSHLSKLPIDSLKIDRSFVSQLQPGSDDAAVVGAIIQLGAALRKVVVAEGIETAAQMQQLRDLGCGYGQGYHLATPLSAELTSAWLNQPGQALH